MKFSHFLSLLLLVTFNFFFLLLKASLFPLHPSSHYGSSPFFGFPCIFLSFMSAGLGSQASAADLKSDDGTTPPPCWSAICKITAIEGQELSPEASPTSEPPHSVKVTCRSDGVRVSILQDLCLHQMPSFTKVLEIFNTSIHLLESSSFSTLGHLKKIDLRNNKIGSIEPSAFRGLSSLKRLDLSHNNISSLNGTQLEGLQDLVRLKVSHNPLTTLHPSLRDVLPSLRAIEIGDTLLRCDCHLAWLLREPRDVKPNAGRSDSTSSIPGGAVTADNRKKRRPLRLLGGASCQGPKSLRGTKLRKVSPSQMICEKSKSTSVSLLEIEPGVDQVVFAGDSLKLRCRVTGYDSPPARVWWRWDRKEGHMVRDVVPQGEGSRYDDVTIKISSRTDRMESYVHIPELSWDHSGEWSCVVEGGGKNSSRSLSIYVIHHGTKYCPVNVTSNNKGIYSWPRTVSSVSVELPCQGLSPLLPSSHSSWTSLSFSARRDARQARHFCGAEGTWHSLNTSQCPYVSEATRILEHFATTNLSAASSSLSESARTLRNFTANGAVFMDPIDVVFLAQTVHQYTQLISQAVHVHPAAEVLVDVIASSLTSSKELLNSAEGLQGSCTSLLSSLWKLMDDVPTLTRAATPHLHLYQVGMRSQSFAGVSCVWFRKSRRSVEKHFRCNTNNYSLLYAIEEDVTDARIRVPSNLFANFTFPSNGATEENKTSERDEDLARLQFFVYDSAKLFPTKSSDSWQITSPVIGTRMNDAIEIGSSNGIYVTLRSVIYSQNIAPAIWEPGVNGTQGDWVKGKCQIIRVHNSMVVFKCHKLAHFGLLQDMAAFDGSYSQKGAKFKLSPPGVYVGSIVCCLFLMASIATWGIHHNSISTMNKNKHSFLNTWVALLFLVTLFTVGIYQTDTPRVCQAVGVLLHYLTTCVLLWIIVSVTNLYKKVSKALRPPLPTDEPLSDVPLPPKPMLRFYLVGWGIALIVCGISAAVNLRHYGTFSYCFLAWGPSVAAFYAPSIALVLILAAFFLLTQCVLNTSHAGYSEATGNTETTELELLDAASPASENPPSERADDELSIVSHTSTLSLTDAQHSPITQLRAHAVTLILFLLTWASAAITAAAPFASVIPFHSTIFSVMYGICASSLGIFIFIFFCASRSDVVEAWKEFPAFCVSPTREDETHLTVANNVVNTHSSSHGVPTTQPAPTNNQLLLPTSTSPCVAPSVHSVDSSNTHQTNKSSSLSQSVHASNKAESLSKTSNALHMLNLSSLSESVNYVPEMFYNPKQAGVAKRFFQKQRLKQMMKQNNLDMNRTDSDCNSSTVYKPRKTTHNIHSESDVSGFDASYLEVSNKINNTNIHVDSMYTGNNKHTAKALTPELLCVLGPPKDTCTIVSSVENDQYQWPITIQHQCVQNPGFYHPKNLNVPRSPLSRRNGSLSKEDITRRISPVLLQEARVPGTLPYPEPKSPENKLRRPTRPLRGQRPPRTRRKRSRSRGSGREDLDWSEEDEGAATHPKGIDSPSPAMLDSSQIDDLQSRLFTNPQSTSLSFSPVSSSPSPIPSSLPLATFNSPSSLSPTTPHLGRFSPSCAELEWMHLLTKRRPCRGEGCSPFEEKGYLPNEPGDRFCTSCSDGESTEGAVKREPWQPSLDDGDFAEISATAADNDDNSLDAESVGGRSSAATSMAPGADPSPPPSLPVSDSPFDSPHRKFHQNTPDSLSLDSGSLLSPLRSQFSSMDNPPLSDLGSPAAEPLTPTASTPVNPPVSPVTPVGSSREHDLNTVGSSRDLALKVGLRENEVVSLSSRKGPFDPSHVIALHRGGNDIPMSEPPSPTPHRSNGVPALHRLVPGEKKADRKSSSSESLPATRCPSGSKDQRKNRWAESRPTECDSWVEWTTERVKKDLHERDSTSSRETDV